MDLNKYFPLNNQVTKNQVNTLIIAIVIYIVASIVVSFVLAFLSFVPVINLLVQLVSLLFNIYCLVGLILAILKYVN